MDDITIFCVQCGKLKVQEWTGRYEAKTGDKKYRMVCPEAPCEHGEHLFEEIKHSSIWRCIFGPSHKCVRCPRTIRASFYYD